MSPSLDDLHPAQNRGFRELYASARLVGEHYRALADVTGEESLRDAAGAAGRLIEELGPATERYGLYGHTAAQGVGVTAARAQSALPARMLERNQALRVAVLDLQHVVTLLGYLATVSATHGTADLAELCRRWEAALSETEDRVRATAAAQGARPDQAIEPLHDSAAGRAGHKIQLLVGTFGEWFDRRTAHRD